MGSVNWSAACKSLVGLKNELSDTFLFLLRALTIDPRDRLANLKLVSVDDSPTLAAAVVF